MRSSVLVLSLMLLFIGLALASSYNATISQETWITVAERSGEWTISSDFGKGENMTLFIAWSALTYGEDLGELPVNVTITAIDGDETDFEVYFIVPPNSSPPPGQEDRWPIYVSRIQLLHNDDRGLEVPNPPTQIGGITKQQGEYTARVHPPPDSFPWSGVPPEPPRALNLLKAIVATSYPYRILLPVGGMTSFFGIAVLFYGTRTKRKKRSKIKR